jgi:hypothetical protein
VRLLLAIQLAAVLALGRLAVHGGVQAPGGVLLAHPGHAQLVRHTPELVDAFAADEALRTRFVALLREAGPVLSNRKGEKVSEELARNADAFLETLDKGRAGSALGKTLHQLRSDLKGFPRRTVHEGLKELERGRVPREEPTSTRPPEPATPSAE